MGNTGELLVGKVSKGLFDELTAAYEKEHEENIAPLVYKVWQKIFDAVGIEGSERQLAYMIDETTLDLIRIEGVFG